MKHRLPFPSFSFLPLVAALLLGACASGPDYTPVSTAAPAAFRHQDGWRTVPAESWQHSGSWWQAFGDPALNQLLDDFERGNLTLAQAQARLRQAEATLRGAQAGRSPSVGASVSATRSGGGGSSAPGNRYAAGLDASWSPDLWGRIARQVEAEQAGVQASAADLAAVRLSTQVTLVQAYLRLRVLDRQRVLLAQSQAAYERSLELTRNQYRAGVAARSDVIQAETQLQSLLSDTYDLQWQRAQQEHALAVLTGRASSDFTLADSDALPQVPELPPQLPSVLLTRRPDVVAAERQVAAANARIGVAQGAWWPELSLSASAGGQGARWAGLLSAPNRVWSLGPALAATLLDGGARSAGVAQAQAAYDEQVAAYRQTVLDSLRNVDDALVTLQALAAKAEHQQRLLALAEENERAILTRYRAGLVSFLEVSVAQTLTLSSRRAVLDVQAERLDASVALIAALGGGWQAPPP